jgi:hypothetical protein
VLVLEIPLRMCHQLFHHTQGPLTTNFILSITFCDERGKDRDWIFQQGQKTKKQEVLPV